MNLFGSPRKRFMVPALATLMVAFAGGTVLAEPIADVGLVAVSPRDVASAPDDVFDVVSSGLNAVGVGQKVYLEGEPLEGQTVNGYEWALSGPAGSNAALSATSGELVTFVPDARGTYIVTLVPLDGSGAQSEAVEIKIYAGFFVGVGEEVYTGGDPDIPNCGNSCCHAESSNQRLNVVDQWLGSNHSSKFIRDLSGEGTTHYRLSCLPCHTIGYDPIAVNNGFDDIANAINFDLNQIPTWAIDAASGGPEHWSDLPDPLKGHGNIQCESCHGAGSEHLGNLIEDDNGIGGVNLDPGQCAVCHDSGTHHIFFYQWSNSHHEVAAEAAHSSSCVQCHTGEGFVAVQVDNVGTGNLPEHPNGITCSACHDPHGSENDHQLRVVGPYAIGNGAVHDDPGKGGICMRCHEGRIDKPVEDPTGRALSSRGAHYGTQTDMYLGANLAEFGLPVQGNSAHTTIVEDSCVACHMAIAEGNMEVGGHSFVLRDDNGTPEDESDDVVNLEPACVSCHPGLDTLNREARGDYDGDRIREGVMDEVKGLLALLQPGLVNLGCTVAANGTLSISNANFANLTTTQKLIRYNYNFVVQDGSYGIHNTSYVVQILQRSYGELYGHPITDDYPNIELRGPVQPSTKPTPTPTPTPIITPTPFPTPTARALVDIFGVSPRDVALHNQSGIFDEVSSGNNTIGVGEKMYMKPVPELDDKQIVDFDWAVISAPANSVAQVNDETGTGTIVSFRPDKIGTYVIRLTAVTATKQVVDTSEQRVYANQYVGAGVYDPDNEPRAPECATSFCHGDGTGNPRLNVADQWLESPHATKLIRDLNGETTDHYGTYCLPCHSLGYNLNPLAVNNGFDDIAARLNFDLNQIPDMVHDAYVNGTDHWEDLPVELRGHGNIQCESCHGAGSGHPANLTQLDIGIDGANLNLDQCAQCHDSASGFQQQFYQWGTSAHKLSAEAAHNTGCVKCHTGEGFVDVQVNGLAPVDHHDANGITCSACHDPHGSDNPNELRLTGDTVLPEGDITYGAGTGGLCMRCHNSRIANPDTTSLSSYRGAHHGPQGEMLLGTGAVEFGIELAPNSPHEVAVEDTCVHCHMADPPQSGPGVLTPPAVGGHSYAMRDTMGTEDPSDDVTNAENACQSCHFGLDTYNYQTGGDYDGDGMAEGVQEEVKGLLLLLQPGILAAQGTSIAEDGTIAVSSGDFAKMTPEQKQARYNYNFIVDDGSYGVHNTSYCVQILQRTYGELYGRPITQDFPAIDLRGPVQQVETSSDGWLVK